MRAFYVQLKREIGAIMLSPIAYVFLLCLTLINAYAFGVGVENLQYSSQLNIVQQFFLWFMFWFALILMIPILTMRIFSEEYKSGTIEMLLTAPIREWEVVLAKFFGAFVFYSILWLPSMLFFWLFQIWTKNAVPMDWPALGLCYATVGLIGMFYISIGLFTSSLTKNQIIAAVCSFAIILLIFCISILQGRTTNPELVERLNYFSSYSHMRMASLGIFDTRPVIFYLSTTALFLVLTERTLAVRKLKS